MTNTENARFEKLQKNLSLYTFSNLASFLEKKVIVFL